MIKPSWVIHIFTSSESSGKFALYTFNSVYCIVIAWRPHTHSILQHRSNVNLECTNHDVWNKRHKTLMDKSCTTICFCDYTVDVRRKLERRINNNTKISNFTYTIDRLLTKYQYCKLRLKYQHCLIQYNNISVQILVAGVLPVSYTHLTLPTNREV